ncbi:MAG: four helix bundle protein [Lacipirellulaceae bacterium]
MQDYRNLDVWRYSHQVTLLVYKATGFFPKDERFGLVSQLRRAASSVGSNIAEGCGRGSDADFARFLQMAQGSASEVDYQLLLAKDLGFLSDEEYESIVEKLSSVRKMLNALLSRLRRN